MKSNVAVKLNRDPTTTGMKRNVRLFGRKFRNTAIIHYRTNNLKNNENAEHFQLI